MTVTVPVTRLRLLVLDLFRFALAPLCTLENVCRMREREKGVGSYYALRAPIFIFVEIRASTTNITTVPTTENEAELL
jgi:hypothetical protein